MYLRGGERRAASGERRGGEEDGQNTGAWARALALALARA
jgi:hypothetical protein